MVDKAGNFERVALVVNARARTGAEAYERAEKTLRDLGVPLSSTYPLRDPARLPETVAAAVDEGSDLVVVGGGDGTISSVVDVLAHREIPMGLLPLGTANDFARTLHIPVDVEEACRTIAHGKIVDIDLGLTGDNYYVNRASIGLGAQVAQAISPFLKKWVGPLAYPVAAAKVFARNRPFTATLTFPDGDHDQQEYTDLLQISIANGRFFGGGQVAVHDAGIDDDTLDISVLRHGKMRELIPVFRNLKTGDLPETDRLIHIRTQRVDITTEPKLAINVDGELVAHTPQRFSIAPDALHIVVPDGWTDGH